MMNSITKIETPFPEKFGVPRQSNLVTEAWGAMRFPKNDFYSEAFRGIEDASHLWLIFEFHQIPDGEFNGLIRPPRFENKKKLGVYATRTPHRPNRLGLSVVKFERLEMSDREIILKVSGVDMVDGTPIFDIKPYIPYTDKIEDARAINFEEAPRVLRVDWHCEKPKAGALIENVIGLDPRPGQDKELNQEYGVSIAGYNVRFRSKDGTFEILSCILKA